MHHEEFEGVDKNKDGKVDKDEIIAAGMFEGIEEDQKDEHMHELMEEYDADKNGFLEAQEYVKWVFGEKPDGEMAHVHGESLLEQMDKDGDKHLDISDLTHAENVESLEELGIHTELWSAEVEDDHTMILYLTF